MRRRSEPVNILEAALEYRRMGFNVVPLRARAKEPAIKTLITYFSREATLDEIHWWWDSPSEDNIGVVCGPISGDLAVLDCDNDASYQAAVAALPELRNTMTVRTGRGWHCYVRQATPTIKWEYVDRETGEVSVNHVKGNHSYVVAPPSIHPDGGRYKLVNDAPPLVIEGLLEWVQSHKLTEDAAERAQNGEHWIADLLRQGAGQGSRNDDATRLAGFLCSRLPDDVVREILLLWGEQRCEDWGRTFGERDIDTIVRSVSRYHH